MKTKGLEKAVNLARYYSCWRGCTGYKPRLLRLLVTCRCNSRCLHCNIWRLAKEKPQLAQDELNTQEWVDLLEELSGMGTEAVFVSGGEPLLHKGVLDIIRFAKEKNMHVEMVTNGTLVTEASAKDLVLSGLDIIDFSLDGPSSEIHAEFRGIAGAWEKTTRGIGLLNQARRNLGAERPAIHVSYPVSTMTHSHIEQIVNLKSTLGYDILHFNPIIGKTPSAQALFMTHDDLANLESRLDSIAAEFRNAGMPEGSLVDLARMCRNRDGASNGRYAESLIRRVLCFTPWEEMSIDPFGNVYPCSYACPFQNLSEDLEQCFWGVGDFKMGNVRDSRFSEIWNGDSYRQFRKKLQEFPSFPFCAWCHEASPRDAILTGLFKTPWRLPGIAYSQMLRRFRRSSYSMWDPR